MDGMKYRIASWIEYISGFIIASRSTEALIDPVTLLFSYLIKLLRVLLTLMNFLTNFGLYSICYKIE